MLFRVPWMERQNRNVRIQRNKQSRDRTKPTRVINTSSNESWRRGRGKKNHYYFIYLNKICKISVFPGSQMYLYGIKGHQHSETAEMRAGTRCMSAVRPRLLTAPPRPRPLSLIPVHTRGSHALRLRPLLEKWEEVIDWQFRRSNKNMNVWLSARASGGMLEFLSYLYH